MKVVVAALSFVLFVLGRAWGDVVANPGCIKKCLPLPARGCNFTCTDSDNNYQLKVSVAGGGYNLGDCGSGQVLYACPGSTFVFTATGGLDSDYVSATGCSPSCGTNSQCARLIQNSDVAYMWKVEQGDGGESVVLRKEGELDASFVVRLDYRANRQATITCTRAQVSAATDREDWQRWSVTLVADYSRVDLDVWPIRQYVSANQIYTTPTITKDAATDLFRNTTEWIMLRDADNEDSEDRQCCRGITIPENTPDPISTFSDSDFSFGLNWGIVDSREKLDALMAYPGVTVVKEVAWCGMTGDYGGCTSCAPPEENPTTHLWTFGNPVRKGIIVAYSDATIWMSIFHEFGHANGAFLHVPYSSNLMFASGGDKLKTISQAEWEGETITLETPVYECNAF